MVRKTWKNRSKPSWNGSSVLVISTNKISMPDTGCQVAGHGGNPLEFKNKTACCQYSCLPTRTL